jgi:tetratricopeptide (TPR) repeat protein
MASTEISIKQAVALHQQGNLVEAEAAYKNILNADPSEFDALHMLGIINAQRGSFAEAEKLLRQALAVDNKIPPLLHNHGTVLCNLGRFDEAIESYNGAIELAPNHAPLYSDRANALFGLTLYDQALADYEKALALKPDLADAWLGRGNVLRALKRNAEALSAYDRAIELKSSLVDAWLGRAYLYYELNRHEEALAAFNKVLPLRPALADAWLMRGNILFHLARYKAALADFDKALTLSPDMAAAWLGSGNAFLGLKNSDEALAAYDKAIALNPGQAEAWLGRGNIFSNTNRYDEALAAYDKVLALNPRLAEGWFARGNGYFAINRDHEALQSYEKAIDLKPDNAEALLNKALVKLSLGDFCEGWKLYEWRWKSRFFTSPIRSFSQKLWLGDADIAGKTILIHSEQGFGDIVQFYRYLEDLEKLNCKTIFEAPAPLVPLFAAQKHNSVRIITWGEALPAFDCHIPLLSLPHAFKTTLQTIPALSPYLSPPPAKTIQWRKTLGQKGKPRIGLTWAGNPGLQKDIRRSMPLDLFLPLMDSGAEWYSLQKDVRDADRATLKSNPTILDHTPSLADFADTAALIAELDLVISVDTVVAHLAGALGKPVWVLLPFHPDFRWLRDRTDCPWYPTAKLFRQAKDGDWAGVIDAVSRELRRL